MNKKETIVVNMFGGPGVSKSTMCASVFSYLKWKNVETEMALEYAKDLVWQGSENVLGNQIYVFGKQHQRMNRLKGKVDVIVTDSPLLLSIIYDSTGNKLFNELVISEFKKYNNLNFFLKRVKEYHSNGRLQNEEQAKQLDAKIKSMLETNGINFQEVDGAIQSIELISNNVFLKMKSFY